MPIMDPTSKDIDRVIRYNIRPGRKVFMVVCSVRSKINDKEQVRVHCLCVKDLERDDPKSDPVNDTGMSADARLWNTERGAVQMAKMARGLKYTQPFDTDDDNVWLNNVLASNNGLFVGKVVNETYTGRDNKEKTSAEISEFYPYEGEFDPAWKELADIEFNEWDKVQKERAEKAAQYGNGRRGGGRGGGGSGGGSEPF